MLSTTHIHRTLFRLAALCLCPLLGASASAATTQEDQLFKSQSPHQGAGGAMVKVHRARLEGYWDLGGGNAAAIAKLKQDVQHCASVNKGRAKPVTTWPAYRSATRTDEYVAANRRIVYTSTLGYVIHPEDCSLIGEVVSSAELTSDNGICQIDIDHKIAKGDCDQSGHANAPVPPPVSASKDDVIKQMERNPAMAAMAAQMKQLRQYDPVRTGEQRTILGARCDVWSQKVVGTPNVGKLCYATGGSFIPYGARSAKLGGLLLDSATTEGFQLKATDVKMDTQVGGAVFVPYLAAGYTIEKEQP
jgi:hypothetical protein